MVQSFISLLIFKLHNIEFANGKESFFYFVCFSSQNVKHLIMFQKLCKHIASESCIKAPTKSLLFNIFIRI